MVSCAGLPYDEVERSQRLFTAEVMPQLRTLFPSPRVSAKAA